MPFRTTSILAFVSSQGFSFARFGFSLGLWWWSLDPLSRLTSLDLIVDLRPWMGCRAWLPLRGGRLASESVWTFPVELSFSWTTEGDPHAVYLKEARLPSRSAWPLVAANPSGAVPAPTGLRHTAEFILS